MKYVITAVALALVIAGGASAAYPTMPNNLRGPICANHHTGILRWVRAHQACKKHETRLMVPKTKAPNGAAGPQGAVGPQGAAGPQGLRGQAGPKGDTGTAGPAGPKGATGAKGEAGETGATGAVGPTGPQGPQGVPGERGNNGAPGPQGEPGPHGPAGPTGPQGPAGLGNKTGYLCISNGGDVEWGGYTDPSNAPSCNKGHDLVVKVVLEQPDSSALSD